MRYPECNQPSGRRRRTELGQGLVEYSLTIVLVGIAAILAVGLFEDAIRDTFRRFIDQGEYAPPSLQPIGGEFATRPPSPTPQAAILSFTSNPTSPIQVPTGGSALVNFSVQTAGAFTQFTLDANGDTIVDYTWAPGQPVPSHIYPVGSYVARLTGTTNGGQILRASLNIQVYDNPNQLPDMPPVVSITANRYSGVAPMQVFFTSQVSFDFDSYAAGYRWAIGTYVDSSSGATTAYTFNTPGIYQVLLQVTDNEGLVGISDPITIQVLSATPLPTNTPLATNTPLPTSTTDPSATQTPRPTNTSTPTNTPAASSTPTATNTPTCPYGPYAVPGRIQAENFTCGGQGVAYFDTDQANKGNSSYRSGEWVDIGESGGLTFVGWAGDTEWLRYRSTVATSGLFDFTFRIAIDAGNGDLKIVVDGVDLTGWVSAPNTGSNSTFQNFIVRGVPLLAGARTIEIRFRNRDFYFDYFDIGVAATATPTATITPTPSNTPTPVPPTATPTRTPTATATPAPASVTFTSIDAEDGFILENGSSNTGGVISTTTIEIGDTKKQDSNSQRKGILSFNTSTLPAGAVIQSVTLKIKRSGVTNIPEGLGTITVDISSSFGFSNNMALQTTDFEAAAFGFGVATLNFPSSNGTWAAGNLNTQGISGINRFGKTQFRVYFSLADDDDAKDDILHFYDGGAASADRPQLIINYTIP